MTNSIMKKTVLICAIIIGLIAHSEPSVTGVTARQRYPWNGKVDIVVTIEGVRAKDMSFTDCSFAATNSATGAAIPVTRITQNGSDTGSGTTWTRRYVWDAARDAGAVKVGAVAIGDVALTVDAKMEREVRLWENGPYWAKCNVGATKPEEYGYYFWWGDTVGYKRNAANNGWVSVRNGSSFSFVGGNCPTCGKNDSQLQSAGYIDSSGNLVAAHDAATAHLGAPWRMPTADEWWTLRSNCDTTWTTRNGVYGRLVTGRGAYASNSIFLPAAGHGYVSYLNDTGSNGHYWSSTPYSYYSNYAWGLYFSSGMYFEYCRYYGLSVRPLRGFAQGGVAESAASGRGVTTHLKLDCRAGMRTAAAIESLTYSTEWSGAGNGGTVAVVAVNGEVISEQSGSGTVAWTPSRNGPYELTHQVVVGGEPVGETLTAKFWVGHLQSADIAFSASGCTCAYDGEGHGITVNVTDPFEGAEVTYSRSENGEYTTAPILFTDVTDGAQVYFKIAANGYTTTSGVATVTITPKTLTADMIGEMDECVYTGAAIEPKVTVSDAPPCVITENDYTVTYADNVNAGVGRAIVTGRGNYTGVVERAFTITPRPVTLTSGSSTKGYDGTALTDPHIAISGLGWATGEGATYDVTGSQTEIGESKNTFTFSLQAETKAANYAITKVEGTLAVTPVPDGGPYTETAGEIKWTFMVKNGEASVGGGLDSPAVPITTTGVIAIPTTLGGRPVTSVGEYAFYGCSGLTSVAIPEGVMSIGEYAFYGCSGLTGVTIPEDVTSIGDEAFKDCTELTEVVLNTNVVTIGAQAFANDFWLDNVVLPDSVEEIGDGAYSNCTEMAEVEFGKGLRRVGDSAFENCISLESVVFQEGLVNLGARAFYGQTRLKSVSLPASLDFIGDDAFAGSAYITGVTVPTHIKTMKELFPDSYQKIESVIVPDGEGVIVDSMFDGCTALKSIVIPPTVTNIGASAFANCESLEELGLPDEVTTLGKRAFYGCLQLKTVSLPKMLNAIQDETFGSCPLLDSIVVPASVVQMGAKIYGGGKVYSLERNDLWYYGYSNTTRNGIYGKWYYSRSNFQSLTGMYFLGDAPATQSNTYEGMPSALTSYVVKGTTGWYMSGSPTLPPGGWPASGNTRTITYWTPNEFEVTFDGNGGTPETYVAKQITDTTYSLPKSDPVRTGYLFKGWWTEKTAGAQVHWNTRVTATKAHTLYAHWKSLSDTVTVIFNPNGGTVEPSEVTYPAGVTYGILPVPTRIGHAFTGWYTSQVGGDLVTEATEVSEENDELYAHWTPIAYAVAFNANGGSGTMSAQTHTYNVAQALTANAFYLSGFKFTGWSETAGGAVKYANQAVVENLAEVQGRVVTLYAVWDGANYAVRFDANGGEGIMANQTHKVGVRQALDKCTFTRRGYSFLGWATTPQGVAEYEDEEDVQNLAMQASATVTLYAVWSPNPYAISYDANGGTGTMAPTACLYDKEATVPACGFAKSGYNFAGWATSAEGAVVYAPGQKVLNLTAQAGGTVELYAVWELAGVGAPVFSPGDGTVFKGVCTVTLTCPTAEASIYCRVGSKPKASGKYLYSGPFEITETSTVYAFAKLGDVESDCVTATYTKGQTITFAEAVKAKGITAFTHGGDDAWDVEEGEGQGGVCVRSGAVDDEQVSWFETTVEGPGTIAFKWKASCEEDYPSQEWDHLEFRVDGKDNGRLDGVTDWVEVSKKLKGGTHTLRWMYVKDESDYDGEDCGWVDAITWTPDKVEEKPTVSGDSGAVVTGDAESGYVVQPSAGKTAVEVTIPTGVDAKKVTVEIGTDVETVKPNGAKVKVVKGTSDITAYLDIPAADAGGAVDLTKATVKEAVVKEALDPEAGAEITLSVESPSITTSETKPGLTYTFSEGTTLEGLTPKSSKLGDGSKWSPTITVKGGTSGFYSIGVKK